MFDADRSLGPINRMCVLGVKGFSNSVGSSLAIDQTAQITGSADAGKHPDKQIVFVVGVAPAEDHHIDLHCHSGARVPLSTIRGSREGEPVYD